MRLEVTEIRVERGGRRVLEGLSCVIEPGEALIVTGPNGSGKSTLLRALAGLLPLAGGRIAVTGDADDARSVRELAHYVGHADGNKISLTAGENLAFWAAMLGVRAGRGGALPVAEAVGAFGLQAIAELPVAMLSAGQRRRIALARLLVAARPLWLLDEPMTALDAAAQARLLQHMLMHLDQGGIIVAATHAPLDMRNARHLALRH
ncbi:MAG: heme ABC exporter ATP-binding protein CcmA [Methylobacteriaceae bacterium]|nr:heme ABC exporter ATP-binding protein CcmA [Methylobacteriaceae bacterium]